MTNTQKEQKRIAAKKFCREAEQYFWEACRSLTNDEFVETQKFIESGVASSEAALREIRYITGGGGSKILETIDEYIRVNGHAPSDAEYKIIVEKHFQSK